MTKTEQLKNPRWWQPSYDSSWERVKAAFRRDWEQTKNDFGGKAPDLNQNVKDTVAQAAGKEPIPPQGVPNYEEVERAYRLGHGARSYYGGRYPAWNDDLERELERDWEDTAPEERGEWREYRGAVRRGYEYQSDR